MALDTNLRSVYDIGFAAASGNKESVFETIQNIAPWDTPFYSSAPKVTVTLTTFEWFTDGLAAAATGGSPEGQDFTSSTRSNRSRKANNTQIFKKGVIVSDSQMAASPYGMQNEFTYQGILVMREVARNIESRAWDQLNPEKVTGTESDTAGQERITCAIRGTGSWGASPTSAVNGAITTGAVENVFETVFVAGGRPDRLYLSPGVKADFTNAAQASGVNRMFNLAASDKRLIANVTVYEGNFGTLVVVPDIFIPQSSATADNAAFSLIESQRNAVAIYRQLKHVPMAKNGDHTRGLIITELGFRVAHASANGHGTGITT